LALPAASRAIDPELFEWTAISGGRQAYPSGMALDPSGDIVVTGYSEEFDFGQRSLIVAKYASDGRRLWQTDSGNRGKATGQGIATDRSGNIYVAGRFRDTVTLNGKEYVSGGQSDLFLAKYDPDGNALWTTVIKAGYAGIWPIAITVGTDGNPVIAGSTGDTVAIGKDTLRAPDGNHPLTFAAKFSSEGAALWTVRSGGSPVSFYLSDAVSKLDGNVILSGAVSGQGSFGGTAIGATGPDSSDRMPFLLQLDAAGKVAWARPFPGISGSEPKGLDQDAAGNIYFSMNFWGIRYLVDGDTVRNPGGHAFLLFKTDKAGKTIWHRNLAISGNNEIDGLSAGAEGSVFLKSRFANQGIPSQYMAYSLNGTGTTDLITRFDSSGNFKWYTLIPDSIPSFLLNSTGGIAADPAGDAYVLSSFGGKSILNAKPDTAWQYRMYLAKIGKDRQGPILQRFASPWTQYDPKLGKALYSVAWLKDRFYAGGPGLIISSQDAATWKANDVLSTCSIFGLAYDGKANFVGVGSNGAVVNSTDGLSWEALGHAPVASIYDVTWAGGEFWGAGYYGNIMHSADGLDWGSLNWESGYSMNAIAFSDGVGVAVGDNGTIFTTTDRTHWIRQYPPTTANLYGVAWNGISFAAVGETVVTSPDGKTWTTHTAAAASASQPFWSVKSIQGQFVAVGENGRIAASKVGTEWNSSDFPCSCRLVDIAANANQAVIVGEDGRILVSRLSDILPLALPKPPVSGLRFRIRQDGATGIRIEFYLDRPTPIRIAAFDLAGRKIYEHSESLAAEGVQARVLPLSAPRSGLYFVELATDREKLVGKLRILR
jgi:hypothetical protein